VTEAAPEIDGFGTPLHLPGYFRLSSEVGFPMLDTDNRALADTMQIIAHRLKLVEATGRWRVTGTWREPWKYVPGDVLALAGIYASALVLGRPDRGDDPHMLCKKQF
jgi:hypothetical protein